MNRRHPRRRLLYGQLRMQLHRQPHRQLHTQLWSLHAGAASAALAPVASSNPLDHHGNVVDWFLSHVSAAGGQDAAKKESDAARSFGSQEAGPSSSAHINDMWNWKPSSTASDDLSVMEDTASVSKTTVQEPEPQAEAPAPEVEEPKAAPQSAAAHLHQ